MVNTEVFYDQFHRHSKSSFTLIKDEDFTYGNIVHLINNYARDKYSILDIGCGVGVIDFYLGSKGMSVLGIDVSKKAIKKAQMTAKYFDLGEKVDFKKMNFPIDFPQKRFDMILCLEVLEHLRDDRVAVSIIKNLLSSGGVVIVSSPSINAPLYKLGMLDKFDKKVGHLRRYSTKSIRSLFKDSDLEILDVVRQEGILRNFLFTNYVGGILLKIVKRWPFSIVITFFDDLATKMFGESDIYLVARKK